MQLIFLGLVNVFPERGEEWERIWQPNIWLHWQIHYCSWKINLSLGNTFIKGSLKQGTEDGEHSCWLHFFPPLICSSNLFCISTLKAMRHTKQLRTPISFGRTTSCPVIIQALVRNPLNLPPTSLKTSHTVLRSTCCVIQHATFTLPPVSDARSWVQNSIFPSPASSPHVLCLQSSLKPLFLFRCWY